LHLVRYNGDHNFGKFVLQRDDHLVSITQWSDEQRLVIARQFFTPLDLLLSNGTFSRMFDTLCVIAETNTAEGEARSIHCSSDLGPLSLKDY
jgi:hypothetical protein